MQEQALWFMAGHYAAAAADDKPIHAPIHLLGCYLVLTGTVHNN